MESASRHRVVIVGGGFGGLYLARGLRDPRFLVTLVDRRNFHLFQPLLYQVATGGLSPADIASPLRKILKRQANAEVLLGEAVDLDPAAHRLILADGSLQYDTLVVAAGARHHYFGNDRWEALAPGLKTVEDATEIRGRILLAFEKAEREPDAERRHAWLTFVVVGGGPTGVELAGAIADLSRDTLRRDFRTIDPADARILLVEGSERILGAFPPDLSAWSEGVLARMGVSVTKRAAVVGISAGEVAIRRGDAIEEIQAGTVLWAAGVKASPLGEVLAEKTGARLDPAGRVVVERDFSLPGHPEVFVIGDLASYSHPTGRPLPGLAPIAMQEGRYVAKVLRSRLDDEAPPEFRYSDRGSLATIGRAAAVGMAGGMKFTGFLAWLVWLFVHLLYLAGFENRVLVLVQWAWNYFTRNRSARLITEARATREK